MDLDEYGMNYFTNSNIEVLDFKEDSIESFPKYLD